MRMQVKNNFIEMIIQSDYRIYRIGKGLYLKRDKEDLRLHIDVQVKNAEKLKKCYN